MVGIEIHPVKFAQHHELEATLIESFISNALHRIRRLVKFHEEKKMCPYSSSSLFSSLHQLNGFVG